MTSHFLLNETKEELGEIADLSEEVGNLRDELIYYLGRRIPVEETSWLGFMKVGAAYPDTVVLKKFELLQARLRQVNWNCTPQVFGGLQEVSACIEGVVGQWGCCQATLYGHNYG